MNDLLQELSTASDSESSGEESGEEEVKKKDAVDEDDLAECAQLPNYINRFKVSYLPQAWSQSVITTSEIFSVYPEVDFREC